MMYSSNRRSFLKTAGLISAGVGLGGFSGLQVLANETKAEGAPNAEKLGWHVGLQAWTLHQATLFEAIDSAAALGLKYMEVFPGQKLSPDSNEKMDVSLSVEGRKLLKQKLADKGVKILSFGVVELSKDEAAARKMFEFAKDMGFETLVPEPPEDAFDLLEKLCEEYKINVAIHNHPKPSHYWDAETVLKVCQNRSKRIGACADTGHWVRSGLNPVECLKKLQGRVINVHLKDLNKKAPDGHDVPWGTGVSDIKAILTELHRQNFKGLILVEYEHNWGKAMPELAECVKFLNKVAGELADASQTGGVGRLRLRKRIR